MPIWGRGLQCARMETLDAILERALLFPSAEKQKTERLKITILVPCYNEEKNVRAAVESWLTQTRPADEIIAIDDSSTDQTGSILSEYSGKIRVLKTEKNFGNKSYAQEFGLKHVTGDVIVTTDGDTRLDPHFLEEIEKDFQDPSISAVAGYVKSLPYNILTACRALDYVIGQNIDKRAQQYLDFMFVIPGAAGAFRVDVFRNLIGFDHDTLTEDLDFTYKLHRKEHRIAFNRNAISYTQDPADLKSYVNQTRRWYGGSWQNLVKHFHLPKKPGMALELSLMCFEGLVFSLLLLVLPLINPMFTLSMFSIYGAAILGLASYAAWLERRFDILLSAPWYILLRYVHAWIYLEQFFLEVILRRRKMTWLRALRVRV
ncbi:MAG: hypothetical protein RIQ56_481 [Candidatus Parcubacteria bacterium]